jgi:hypothetical protein
MKNAVPAVQIYRLHVWICQISPMIWRRLLVRSDCTIADLHYTLQIAFGWSDEHLNRFQIHGQDYGVYHDGGLSFSSDPRLVRLSDFDFRLNERFSYEYDFTDYWLHTVRVEAIVPPQSKKSYPLCVGGKRRAPPEDCGGAEAFMARRDEIPLLAEELYDDILDDLERNDMQAIRGRTEEIRDLQEWLNLDDFDRGAVNDQLQQRFRNIGTELSI